MKCFSAIGAIALALLAGAAMSGCHEQADGELSYPYRITVTTGMIADIVRNVAGEHAQVTQLMNAGVDPHLYRPTSSDVTRIRQSHIVFYNGLMLEGKMADTFVRLSNSGKPIHAVTELLAQGDDYVMTDDADHFDPHVWMDVKGWMAAVKAVAGALSDFDAQHSEDYEANAKAYLAKLERLDAYAKQAIASIPEDRRVLVTAHDAFGYFGRAYGIEVRGIQGLSTESEAAVKDINDMVRFLAQRDIPAVFVETSVADKNVKALIEGASAVGHKLTIGGELFSDAMGTTGTYEGTYIGMIDHNVTTITRALGGNAPADGFAEWDKANQP